MAAEGEADLVLHEGTITIAAARKRMHAALAIYARLT
jgi:hypothetical protein